MTASATTVRLLPRRAIDAGRWDAAVASDACALPYGLSWWLDAATDSRWYGMVLDDYRVVLPLPYTRSLLGVRNAVRPDFTQQLGPWGDLRAGDLHTLLKAIPFTVYRTQLSLREGTPPSDIPPTPLMANHSRRTNFLLDLSRSYTEISAAYRKSLRKQVGRYPGDRLLPASHEEIIDIYRAGSGLRSGLQAKHYASASRLMEACAERDAALFLKLVDEERRTLAAGFLPYRRGRMVYAFASSTAAGRAARGEARLLDRIIRRYAGRAGHILDFEGSDIPGVANFFAGFGPVNHPYLEVSGRRW